MPRSQGTSRKGKPKKNEREAGMGRALARAQVRRFTPKSNGSSRGEGMAMAPGTTNIGVEDDPNERKLLSVLEMDDLADFLGQAQLANRAFVSEREQFIVLDEVGTEIRNNNGIRVQWEDQVRPETTDFIFKELSVPRRPPWDETTTPEELDVNEKEAFLQWRRGIAAREEQLFQESQNARVTPFEKNLEVWRQLWRVMERSACVLQIVDARNPLFYLSDDLRSYAVEDLGKPMLLLINKSDFLSQKQRKEWHEYFQSEGWDHVFFSAHQEQEKLDNSAYEERKKAREIPMADDNNSLMANQQHNDDDDDDEDLHDSNTNPSKESSNVDSPPTNPNSASRENIGIEMPLTRQQLLDWLLSFAKQYGCQPDARFEGRIQFGMVGFPNVGKSSVINVLVGSSRHSHGVSRVGVAAQPGKTKHFQTLLLPDRDDMMLCDCPGLVFPSFVSNAADLIAAGVYPIAQMRDFWPVIELICQRIPREILNAQYGIQLPIKKDLGNRDIIIAPPSGEDLLTTYCIARSMLAPSSGVPDFHRAARIVIKDYAEGRLLFNHAPPTTDGQEFRRETIATALTKTRKLQEKLGSSTLQQEKSQQVITTVENLGGSDDIPEDDSELDLDILDWMDGGGGNTTKAGNGEKRGKSHKTMQKWGKKGRKFREKDPYGCHSNPDEMLPGSSSSHSTGLVVMAGRYGKKGYTRPTSYAGPKTSEEFVNRSVLEKRSI
jgi:large subunit GTPase 1